jgi:hemerythrin-like domain-containing protein
MNHASLHHGTPTQVLRNEHEVILKVLRSFETGLKRVESGIPPDGGFFGKAIDFFQGFADRCHHGKEEQHLFPAMAQAGVPEHGGPVGVMLEEHDQGRAHIRGMAAAIEEIASRPNEGRTAILEHGWAYVQLLKAHIQKENDILFPMADRVIGSEKMQELARAFECVETEMGEGTHQHYVSLADDIEEQAEAYAI